MRMLFQKKIVMSREPLIKLMFSQPNQSNFTPITIMVENTISAVKSRRLLKVLLDSGSTMTVIGKKCLLKIAKHAKHYTAEKYISRLIQHIRDGSNA